MYINHHLGFILLFDLDLDICQSLICENCLEVISKYGPQAFNPIKAGGSESMHSLGGAPPAPPPLEKGLRE